MRKVWAVVRREFVERVRSKWFWVTALLGPLFFGAIVIIPLRLSMSGGGAKRVLVVDGTTTGFGVRVADSLVQNRAFIIAGRAVPHAGLLDSLREEVGAKRLVSIDPQSGTVTEIVGNLPIGLPGAPGGLPTNTPTGVGVGASGTIYFSSDIENAIYKVTKK